METPQHGAAPPHDYLPPGPPLLRDPWLYAEPIRLNGPFERGQLHPIASAIMAYILGILVSQVVVAGGLVGYGVLTGAISDPAQGFAGMVSDPRVFLAANAIGLMLGFGAIGALGSRLHSPDWTRFIRFRRPSWPVFGVATVGMVAVMPFVQWLGALNRQLPLPQSWLDMEQAQVELLARALSGTELSVGFLLLTIAVAPSIFEEVLFRGFLQRQVERSWGVIAAILVVGFAFAFLHLRPTQFFPLAALGFYLGFSVWATGSLWTGIWLHFMNNGFAVLAAAYVERHPTLTLESVEAIDIPILLAAGAAIVVTLVCIQMRALRRLAVGDRQSVEEPSSRLSA